MILYFRMPSLSPLVEYMIFGETYDVSVIHNLLHYGSEVNIKEPRCRIKIVDKYGVLDPLKKLNSPENDELFEVLVNAAGVFNIMDIERQEGLSEERRAILLSEACVPRRLKHQARIQIRRCLSIPVPENIDKLPLPRIIKEYLLYQRWDESCIPPKDE